MLESIRKFLDTPIPVTKTRKNIATAFLVWLNLAVATVSYMGGDWLLAAFFIGIAILIWDQRNDD